MAEIINNYLLAFEPVYRIAEAQSPAHQSFWGSPEHLMLETWKTESPGTEETYVSPQEESPRGIRMGKHKLLHLEKSPVFTSGWETKQSE